MHRMYPCNNHRLHRLHHRCTLLLRPNWSWRVKVSRAVQTKDPHGHLELGPPEWLAQMTCGSTAEHVDVDGRKSIDGGEIWQAASSCCAAVALSPCGAPGKLDTWRTTLAYSTPSHLRCQPSVAPHRYLVTRHCQQLACSVSLVERIADLDVN